MSQDHIGENLAEVWRTNNPEPSALGQPDQPGIGKTGKWETGEFGPPNPRGDDWIYEALEPVFQRLVPPPPDVELLYPPRQLTWSDLDSTIHRAADVELALEALSRQLDVRQRFGEHLTELCRAVHHPSFLRHRIPDEVFAEEAAARGPFPDLFEILFVGRARADERAGVSGEKSLGDAWVRSSHSEGAVYHREARAALSSLRAHEGGLDPFTWTDVANWTKRAFIGDLADLYIHLGVVFSNVEFQPEAYREIETMRYEFGEGYDHRSRGVSDSEQ